MKKMTMIKRWNKWRKRWLRIARHIIGFDNPYDDVNDDNVMSCAYMCVWDDFDEIF